MSQIHNNLVWAHDRLRNALFWLDQAHYWHRDGEPVDEMHLTHIKAIERDARKLLKMLGELKEKKVDGKAA